MSKYKAKHSTNPANTSKKFTRPPNPFDLKVTKNKFDILNRNNHGSQGRPGLSQTKSFKKRERTMLPELRRRGRTGEIIDRRFGEHGGLSSEEKMQERFSRERLRINKKKMRFNLNEPSLGKEDTDFSHTLTLTHRGKLLTEDAMDSDPELDNDYNDNDYNNHVGEDLLYKTITSDDQKRTKNEIMQEIITKSKQGRLERQRMREENDDLCEDLDASLQSVLALGLLPMRPANTPKIKSQPDPYRESLRALTFERRGQPSDPIKTTDELAAAKMAKLDRIEKEMALSSSEDSDDHDSDTMNQQIPSSPAERSLQLIRDQADHLITAIIKGTKLGQVNELYRELAALCSTRSIIPVGQVFQQKISQIAQQAIKLWENGETLPCMPERNVLVLFHLINALFPKPIIGSQKKKHPIVVPTISLMTNLLSVGRLLKPRHVLSALFMAQTLLEYTKETSKLVNEVFGILYPLLSIVTNIKVKEMIPYPKHRMTSKSLFDFLSAQDDIIVQTKSLTPIGFDELLMVEEEAKITKSMLVRHMLYILKNLFTHYSNHCCAQIILSPFLSLLSSWPVLQDELSKMITLERPLHLILAKPKPIAIPSLEPEFGSNIRESSTSSSVSKEEKEKQLLSRAYKREFRGAKRELRRDSAFLAKQKSQARQKEDIQYQERLRGILGLIANESAQSKSLTKRHRQ